MKRLTSAIARSGAVLCLTLSFPFFPHTRAPARTGRGAGCVIKLTPIFRLRDGFSC